VDDEEQGEKKPVAADVGIAWAIAAAPLVFGLSRCPIAVVAEGPCPVCGSIRALGLFLRGDLVSSFRVHPLALPFAIATALVAEASLRAALLERTPRAIVARPYGQRALGFYVGVAGCMLLLWALRELGAFGGPVLV